MNKLHHHDQPQLDNFSEAITLDIIKSRKAQVLGVHFTQLDTYRHKYGLMSPEAMEALEESNERIQRIIEETKKAGTFQSTNFVVLGDHGGNDFDKIIYPNTLFAKEDYLRTDTQGRITSWNVYGNSCGGSMHIYVKGDNQSKLLRSVKFMFDKIMEEDDSPIKACYGFDEVYDSHQLAGDFDFVLEANDGYVFRNDIKDSWILPRDQVPGSYRLDHGFLPDHENLRTLLLAFGPDIKSGVVLESGHLINEGPTLAALIGHTLPQAQGQAIHEILK